jgi:hypothetical protein
MPLTATGQVRTCRHGGTGQQRPWPSKEVALTHIVTGLIANPSVLDAFSRRHSLHQPVALRGELAMLPLREVDLHSFRDVPSHGETKGFEYLSKQLVEELRRSSCDGPLMYFETEYFGGLGTQGAAVFQDGEPIFGPMSAEIGPINHALQLLGVRVEPPARDEFETMGLGRHRNTEGWLEH